MVSFQSGINHACREGMNAAEDASLDRKSPFRTCKTHRKEAHGYHVDVVGQADAAKGTDWNKDSCDDIVCEVLQRCVASQPQITWQAVAWHDTRQITRLARQHKPAHNNALHQ